MGSHRVSREKSLGAEVMMEIINISVKAPRATLKSDVVHPVLSNDTSKLLHEDVKGSPLQDYASQKTIKITTGGTWKARN